MCLLTIAGIAQNNDFVFYTDNGDKFTLYINNTKQNETALTNVKAENISGKTLNVRVVFERTGVPTLSRTMSVSNDDKEIKIQLVKGRENIYSMKTVSTTPRQHNNPSAGNSGHEGSTETKDDKVGHAGNGGHNGNNNGHGNGYNNNGHGNGYNNNGHGNNNNNHGNGGYNNGGHNNDGHGNGGHGYNNGNNNGYGNNYGMSGNGPSDNPRCHIPMPQNEYNTLKSQVKAKYFDSSRLTIAKQACRYNCMTSDQIRDLCRVFSYESNKLDFAKYAFDYCYDRYRYYIVGQAFAYSSSVDALNRYIYDHTTQQPYGANPGNPNNGYSNGYSNGYGYIQCDNPECRYFMTDHDFSDLKHMINNTPYSSTKMTIAKQACQVTCISAEQVREICRLFTFDSDRLTFAKYAYDHCYDRRNYYKVNEVFTFTSSVNELNRFINQHAH